MKSLATTWPRISRNSRLEYAASRGCRSVSRKLTVFKAVRLDTIISIFCARVIVRQATLILLLAPPHAHPHFQHAGASAPRVRPPFILIALRKPKRKLGRPFPAHLKVAAAWEKALDGTSPETNGQSSTNVLISLHHLEHEPFHCVHLHDRLIFSHIWTFVILHISIAPSWHSISHASRSPAARRHPLWLSHGHPTTCNAKENHCIYRARRRRFCKYDFPPAVQRSDRVLGGRT